MFGYSCTSMLTGKFDKVSVWLLSASPEQDVSTQQQHVVLLIGDAVA